MRQRAGLWLVIIALVFPSMSMTSVSAETSVTQAISVVIDASNKHQVIENFGASDAWSMDPIGKEWSEESKTRIADLLFSVEEGIGLSAWRFNIGAGSTETDQQIIGNPWRRSEAFKQSEHAPYDWSKQAGQQWFLEAANEREVDTLIAFVNSPPVWMTKNGHAQPDGSVGSTNLKSDYVDDFAVFLSDVIEHFDNEKGIQFDYISPINEPTWDWNRAGQEANRYNNDDLIAVINELYAELQQRDLHNEVKISAPDGVEILSLLDDTYYQQFVATYTNPSSGGSRYTSGANGLNQGKYREYIKDLLGNQEISAKIDHKIASHSYWSDSRRANSGDRLVFARELLLENLQQYNPDARYWVTEYCILGGSTDIDGNGRDLGITPALVMARTIHYDLSVANASAWQWWTAVSKEDYKDGLIYTDYQFPGDKESIYESKLLWGLGNYSKFIRPGAERIELTGLDQAPYGLMGSSYIHEDNQKVTTVYVNNSTEAKTISMSIDQLPDDNTVYQLTPYITSATEDLAQQAVIHPAADGSFSYTIPAQSIVTLHGDYYDSDLEPQQPEINTVMSLNKAAEVNIKQALGAQGYKLIVKAAGEQEAQESATFTSTSFTLEELENGVSYHIQLVAINSNGESEPSDAVVVIPSLQAPEQFGVKAVDEGFTINFASDKYVPHYAISWGTEPGEYEDSIVEPVDGKRQFSSTITGLTNGQQYYVAVQAIDGDDRSSFSAEQTVIPLHSIVPQPQLVYYVDAGDDTPHVLEEKEVFGMFNGVEDQAYGLDPVTNMSWGYIADDNRTWANGGSDANLSIRQYDGTTYGNGLAYKFSLPNGTYRVSVGFDDPWNDTNRSTDIVINDQVVESDYIIGAARDIKQYEEILVEDGELTVKILKRSQSNPMLSWIKVEKDLLYYVDAGDSSPSTLEEDEELGLRNSVEEQAYGADAVTGFHWGYVADGNLTWANESEDKWESIRQFDGNTNGQGLSYKFEVPYGKYTLELGFDDPWDYNNRHMDIYVEGERIVNSYVIGKEQDTKRMVDVEVTDGELDIKIVKAGNDKPLISWLSVAADRGIPSQAAIKDVQAGDESVTLLYDELYNASYQIQYGTQPGVYSHSVEVEGTSRQHTIEGLDNEVDYYFVIRMVRGAKSGKPSEEWQVTPTAPEIPSTFYFVDAGADVIREGVQLGARNSVPDQPYGDDGNTGYAWGYIADDGQTWAKSDEVDPYLSVRQYDGVEDGKGLAYKFELPNGTYKVDLGFDDPWDSNSRVMDVLIQGELVLEDYVIGENRETKTFTVQVEGNELEVKLVKSGQDKPMISWLAINPSEDEPGDGEPGDGEPGDGEPGDGEPGDGEPGDGEPGDGEPGDGEPGDGEPGDGDPGDGDPGDGEPGDGDPGDGEPGDGDPGDGEPGDGEPGDGEPGDGDPGDGEPGDGDPGDGDPGDGDPDGGEPKPSNPPSNGTKPTSSEDAIDVKLVTSDDLKNTVNGAVNIALTSTQTEVRLPLILLDQISSEQVQIVAANGIELLVPISILQALQIADEHLAIGELIIKLEPTTGQVQGNYKLIGNVYSFELLLRVNGQSKAIEHFAEPVKVSFPYDPLMMNIDLLGVYYFNTNTSKWEYMGGEIQYNSVTVYLDHFSHYALMTYDKSYPDVSVGHWAYNALQLLTAKHIASGITEDTFAPNELVNRAQFTALIADVLGLKSNHSEALHFHDVPEDAWYRDAVAAAHEAGIIQGKTELAFAPDESLTREQMALLIVRSYEYLHGSIQASDAELERYRDKDEVSRWAQAGVSKSVQSGLMQGKSVTRFDPTAYATRIEAIQVIYNLIEKMK